MSRPRGEGPGPITRDGCAVELYALLPAGREPGIVHAAIPAGASILELGAGAGRLTHPLLALGHPVVAVDDSPEMLAHVRGGETVLGRIETLRLGRRFDAVLLASHLVNTDDDRQRRQFLLACRRHVRGGGAVLLQRHDPAWFDTAAPSRRTEAGVTFELGDLSRPGPGLLSATVAYQVGERRWTQRFTARRLDDAELAATGLAVDAWLDDRTWVRARPDPGRLPPRRGRHTLRRGLPPIGGQTFPGGTPVANRYLFTSESVTEGHPDKMADQVSDAILDEILRSDPTGRVACETLITTGLVVVAGEISTSTYVDIPNVVRRTILDIGYDRAKYGFDGSTCGVTVAIDEQSPDIAQGVDHAYEQRAGDSDPLDTQGAGDQGMMVGYACRETPELMPMPIALAHRLSRRLAEVRRAGLVPYLRPDGKTQVTVEYEDRRPVRLDTVVVSTQHGPDVDLDTLLGPDVREHVIDACLPDDLAADGLRVFVNPTGRFELGGPSADTGLTGRKIIVDTYGGMARHGGGAFSGKDPTKVDRSAAYAVRWVAKNVVAAGLADRCEVQVAYAIGVAHPVSVFVETFGTERVDPEKLAKLLPDFFDLRPAAIVRDLDLRRPIYQKTAAYGHFGRNEPEFTWEATDRADDLAKAASNL